MTDWYQRGFEDFSQGTHWPPYGSAGEEYRRGWNDAQSVAQDDDNNEEES